MVCYSHLSKNISQFVIIHTAKGFSIVNEAEADFVLSGIPLLFLCSSVFGNLISGSSAFSKSSLYIGKLLFHMLF